MDGAWSPERHEAAVAWFSGYQLGYILQNGVIPDWFHGIITRKYILLMHLFNCLYTDMN